MFSHMYSMFLVSDPLSFNKGNLSRENKYISLDTYNPVYRHSPTK